MLFLYVPSYITWVYTIHIKQPASLESVHYLTHSGHFLLLYKGGRETHTPITLILFTMRKIEQQMNSALHRKANWTNSNTSVQYNELTNCSQVLLHGHQIATLDHHTNALKLSSCGWQTVTTKSRLNALLSEFKYGCKVFQKNFDWYLSTVNQTVDFWDGMILSGGQIL